MSPSGWLLDTHAMLWMLYGDKRLTKKSAEIIEGGQPIYFSSVSFWEISLKRSSGGFDFEIEDEWDEIVPKALAIAKILEIPIEASDCRFMESLPLHHRDPFDRLMIAQSLRRRLGILGRDSQWDDYGVARVW